MSKRITLKHVAASIEELAVMVKGGFDAVYKDMVTKDDFKEILKPYVTKEEMHAEFKKIHRRFDELEEGERVLEKEAKDCRHHRALTDARLSQLEATRS